MSIKTRRFGASPILLLAALIFLLVTVSATGLDPTRKLDETAAPGSGEVKCGSCTTPVVSPPPPPPSSPPPPSPVLCPPPPYGKPPKNPPSSNGDRPSSNGGRPSPPSYMYIAGPPGDLYPIDNSTSGTGRTSFAGMLPVLAGCAVLGLFVAV